MKKFLIAALILIIGILAGYYFSEYRHNQIRQQSENDDPLNLFGKSKPELDDCLKKVNPLDPLGLNSETEAQKTQRQDCINKYKK